MIPKQGWINLYKPKNITSFKAINSIKKNLLIKKIGHTGTLDPMAEGVLPIAIGKATKFRYTDAITHWFFKLKNIGNRISQ